MIAEPRFDDKEDSGAVLIVSLVDRISQGDPEFILKLAVYVRNDLNIRSTANFLLALAANSKPCTPFLKKYFKHIIRLPSDWLDVAALYQMLPNRDLRGRALPTALRKAMKFKFPEFDTYQLGKYNKQGKIKRLKKKAKKDAAAGKPVAEKPKGGKNQLTMKQMIRQLHINAPVEHVMCVLGKKYPSNETDFRRSGLPGTFEAVRAGKRLKLPVPETWETLLSAKGNKAETWQELIDHKKLPFMAMLRNLRNLILTGVDYKYHRWAMNKLTNEGAVANSRQFPFTFFSAYEAINVDLEKLKEEIKVAKAAGGKPGEAVKTKVAAKPARGGKAGRGRGGRGGRTASTEKPEQRRVKKIVIPKNMPDEALIKKYRDALDTAVKFATVHNVKPIRGSTVVFCSVADTMRSGMAKNAKGMGSVRTLLDIGSLLGLMCKYMCEECDFRIFSSPGTGEKCHLQVELKDGTVLDNMKIVAELANSGQLGGGCEFPFDYMEDLIRERKVIDNFIVLSNSQIAPGYEDMSHLFPGGLGGILQKYRQEVNPDLLFVSVNLDAGRKNIDRSGGDKHPNDVVITGFSDAILKYIAERGDANQLHSIEHIDEARGIKNPPKKSQKEKSSSSSFGSSFRSTSSYASPFRSSASSSLGKKKLSFLDSQKARKEETTGVLDLDDRDTEESLQQKKQQIEEEDELLIEEEERKKRAEKFAQMRSGRWRTARLLVSSTFRDMHGERDWLTRYVFPELRDRCTKRRVSFYDVDLRWGVTEKEAEEGASLEICLDEVDRCRPFFLGILGERYGWAPSTYQVSDEPRFRWTRNYPKGRSITELEMHYGALKNPSEGEALFYYRDPSFLNEIAEERHREEFSAESPGAAQKMAELRATIQKNFTPKSYTCKWGGVVDGKPMTSHLESFGKMVLEDLWNAICRVFPAQSVHRDHLLITRESHEAYLETQSRRFVGREDLIKRMVQFADGDTAGPMVVTGDPGAGKSALMAHFVKEYQKKNTEAAVFYHFVGASPDSTDIRHTLLRIAKEMAARFKLRHEIPEDYKELRQFFPKLLEDAVFVSRTKVVVVIDAINQLAEKERAHSLDWLPSATKVRILVSTYASSRTHDVLRYRKPAPPEIKVGALEEKHARSLVVATLAEFRKKLDESPGNNQMRFLLRKPDAIKPLFLVVACEELRVFGLYEKLTSKIKSLSGQLPKLFDEVLHRLEGDHSKTLLKTALSIIVCSRGGVQETEILGMMARENLHEKELPRAAWAPIYGAIQGFLRPLGETGDGMIDFFHAQMNQAVRKKYLMMRGQEQNTHKLLAAYFLRQLLPEVVVEKKAVGARSLGGLDSAKKSTTSSYFSSSSSYSSSSSSYSFSSSSSSYSFSSSSSYSRLKGKEKVPSASDSHEDDREKEKDSPKSNKKVWRENVRAVSELPHHLIKAQMWSELDTVLCDLGFVEMKCRMGMAFDLVADLTEALASEQQWEGKTRLEDFHRFVSSNAHILAEHPELTLQQAANQPNGSAPAVAAQAILDAAQPAVLSGATSSDSKPWIKWLNKPKSHSACMLTLKGNSEPVMACAVSPDGHQIVVASRDQTLRICDAVTGLELLTLVGHTNWVVGCAYSPDGGRIVSASWDNTLKIWDAKAGVEIATLSGHSRRVNACAFSHDGRRVASGSWDCSAKIWDTNTGKVQFTLSGHTKPVNAISFSPDDKMLVSASWDGTLKLWDALEGKEIRTLAGHTKSVRSVQFSPTGNQIVSTSVDTTVKVWDVRTGAVTTTLTGHSKPVNAASFSADGKNLVSASDDLTVKVWDALGGREIGSLSSGDNSISIHCVDLSADEKFIAAAYSDCTIAIWDVFMGEVAHVLKGHTRTINAVCFSPDGRRLSSCSDDGSWRIWSVADGSELVNIVGHKDAVNCICFSPDGVNVLTAADDFTLGLWNSSTGENVQVMRGHTNRVMGCAYAPDGKRIASASRDNTLRIWEPQSGTVKKILRGHADWLNDCAFSPDGKKLVSSSWDFTVKVWDVKKGRELATLKGHMGAASAVSFSSTGKQIVSSSFDTTIKIWDAVEYHEITTITGHAKTVNDVKCARRGTTIVSGSDDSLIKLWDSVAGQEVNTFQGHSQTIREVTYSPEKNQVVSASDDCTVRVWNAGAESENAKGHTQWVTDCALSRDGKTLVTASRDRTVKLWDTKAKKVRNSLVGHSKAVNAVDISPDGSRIVSGSDDFTIILWDARSGDMLNTIRHHNNSVRSVRFSPDGSRFASASWDNQVCVFDARRGNLLLTLSGHSDWVNSVAFSPDGNNIVSASHSNEVTVWDAFSGARVRTFLGHTNWVSTVAYSPNGDRLVSGSYDSTVKLFDPTGRRGGSAVSTLSGHSGRVNCVAFSRDARSVLSGSSDSTVRVWDSQTEEVLARFFCNAPVTALAIGNSLFAAGDSLGNVYLLDFILK